MKAVHSFYSKPYLQSPESVNGFSNNESMFYSALLSLSLLKKHFEKVELVTDDIGKHLFIDILKMPYDSVRTDIQSIYNTYDPGHWIVGKLKAYEIQEEPFLHVDMDVYMFQALPDHLLRSRVLTQNQESFLASEVSPFNNYAFVLNNIKEAGVYMPESWKWSLSQGNYQQACNMGIYGTNDMNLNRLYVQEAFSFLNAPQNAAFLNASGIETPRFCTVVEQYTLQTICSFYGVSMDYLFEKPTNHWSTFNDEYTHLFFIEKRKPSNIERLAEIMSKDFPEYINRIVAVTEEFNRLKNVEHETDVSVHSGNIVSYEAKENIQKFDMVTIDGWKANSSDVSHRGKVVGIAQENVHAGISATAIQEGEITNPLWSWNLGDMIFLNGNSLSKVAPDNGFCQVIARAIKPDTLLIDLSEPILL